MAFSGFGNNLPSLAPTRVSSYGAVRGAPLSDGAIAGIVVGVVLVLAAVGIGLWQGGVFNGGGSSFSEDAAGDAGAPTDGDGAPGSQILAQQGVEPAPSTAMPAADTSPAGVLSSAAQAAADAVSGVVDAMAGAMAPSTSQSLSALQAANSKVGSSADPQNRAQYVTGYKNQVHKNVDLAENTLIAAWGGSNPAIRQQQLHYSGAAGTSLTQPSIPAEPLHTGPQVVSASGQTYGAA